MRFSHKPDFVAGCNLHMKVLITTPDFKKIGGVANYCSVLKKFLPTQADFIFVGSRSYPEGRLSVLKRILNDIRIFRERIRSTKYDLVHLNPSLKWKAVIRDGLFILLVKQNTTKVLIFFHGWSKNFESRLTGLKLKLFKKLYFKADAIVVLATEFKDQLRSWGYNGPIYVETNLVDDKQITDFQTTESSKNESKDINLLFLARVEKTKGIYEVIEAYRLLKNKCPRLNLTIAGEGSELTAIKEYVRHKKIEGISFFGYIHSNDKNNTFRNASIFVLPTYGEGMPSSILEAMVFGLPVVTRSVGGLNDFFEDGKMGFVTKSKDPSVFANMIMKLIDNPELRFEIGKYNQEYAREHFLAYKVTQRIEKIYQDTIDNTVKSGETKK